MYNVLISYVEIYTFIIPLTVISDQPALEHSGAFMTGLLYGERVVVYGSIPEQDFACRRMATVSHELNILTHGEPRGKAILPCSTGYGASEGLIERRLLPSGERVVVL